MSDDRCLEAIVSSRSRGHMPNSAEKVGCSLPSSVAHTKPCRFRVLGAVSLVALHPEPNPPPTPHVNTPPDARTRIFFFF